MKEETWKPVLNNEGKYMVSSQGRVKSLNYRMTGKEGIMTLPLNSRGYPIVKISRPNEKAKTRTVHQLVAEAFLNHKPNGYELVVHHIDGDRTNNVVSNLQLITQRENISYKRGTSPYTGVTKQGNRWKAAAYLNKKVRHIGMFSTDLEAHQAYLKYIGLYKKTPQLYSDVAVNCKHNHMVF